jgi:tRNA(Ile)-lysidine synthase
VETAGREARLEAFARWARRGGCAAVLTAHHRDDQVETVIAHMLRGAGERGLGGMPARRRLDPSVAAELWRPCLAMSRAELAAYRRAAGLPHREDSTNQDESATRNRLRHSLLPALRARGDIDALILGLSARAASLAAARRAALVPVLERTVIVPPHAAIPPGTLDAVAEDSGLCEALLGEVWERTQGRSGALTREHYRIWARFAAGRGDGRSCDLPRGAAVERAGGWLFLLGSRADTGGGDSPISLPERGEILWRGARIEVGGEWSRGPLGAALPAGVPLEVRGARPGDRILAGGVRHRVGEWLRVAGVPARWRGLYPVIARGEDVVWVPGVRRAAEDGTRRVRVTPIEREDPIAFLLGVRAASGATSAGGSPGRGRPGR